MHTRKLIKMGRKSLFFVLPFALVASLLVAFSPVSPSTSPAYANPEDVEGRATSQVVTGGSPAGRNDAGTCGAAFPSNPVQICGYAPISRSRTVSPASMPENPVKLLIDKTAVNNSYKLFGSGYAGQCLNDTRTYRDPVTNRVVSYQPKGIFWVDSQYHQTSYYTVYVSFPTLRYSYMYFNPDRGYRGEWVVTTNPRASNWPVTPETTELRNIRATRAGQTKTWLFRGTSMIVNVLRPQSASYVDYTAREVSYTCQWPATPSVVSKLCAANIRYQFTGPYGNANTPWPIYTSVNPNKVDYKTLARYWYDPPYNNEGSIVYSPIGWAYRNGGSTLGTYDDAQVSLIANCGDIYATANFRGKPCKLADGTIPAGIDCTFTPGNYNKSSDGYSISCKYASYPVGTAKAGGVITGSYDSVSLGCNSEQPSPFGQDHVANQVHWVCDDPAGKYGWNSTANFSDCGSPVPPENCKIVGGTGITSPNGDAVANAAQVAADGKQWKFSFPRLDCPAAQNVWTSFVVVGNNANDGSQPFRWSSPANASDQPVVGDVTPNSTTSILGKNGDIRGVAGSSNQDLYLRFYKATKVANTSINFGNYNGLSNKFTVAKDQATPFGVYIEYHLTLPTDTYTNIGGNAVVNKPIVLKSEMLYVYPTSGRVTG